MASTVTFNPNSGPSVTVMLNSGGPILTDGFGGWEVVDRPRRVGITRFTGKSPFKQDIPIMFDGWGSNTNQEPVITSLIRMSQQPHPTAEPPKIKLSGQALRKDLTWVIESLEFDQDSAIWDIQGGTPIRLRQAATVHLVQFVDDSVLTTVASPAVQTSAGGKSRVIVSGMTLKSLAQQEYGDPDGYHVILIANFFLDPRPNKVIPKGTRVFIPFWHGRGGKIITVGSSSIQRP